MGRIFLRYANNAFAVARDQSLDIPSRKDKFQITRLRLSCTTNLQPSKLFAIDCTKASCRNLSSELDAVYFVCVCVCVCVCVFRGLLLLFCLLLVTSECSEST